MDAVELLERLHVALRPAVYLEIGIDRGTSLGLSRSRSVAIDPAPLLDPEALEGKEWVKLYHQTSDAFFQAHTMEAVLEGHPLDLAFLAGSHKFVQVVRDLEHIEQWSHPDTMVVIPDVLPADPQAASRTAHEGEWTGDVWRIVPFLQTHRPDLRCWLLDTAPGGVLVVSNFNPAHPAMTNLADALDQGFPNHGPEYQRLVTSWIEDAQPHRPESFLQRSLSPGLAGVSAAKNLERDRMKLIGLVVVRNEADVIRLSILHHLSLGLDSVLVIDNGSTDGTVEILEKLCREDRRVQWRSDSGPFQQVSLRTSLAREAFNQGADWVVPFDADEFWWAEGGNLRAKLAASPAGALRAEVVNFIQQRGQLVATEEALMTMTRRPAWPMDVDRSWVESRQIAYVEMVYPPKWLSRPTSEIVIEPGNHSVSGAAGPIGEGFGLALLHAPLRSRDGLNHKAEHGERALLRGSHPEQSWHLKRWAKLREAGALDQEWAANSYEGTALDVYGSAHPLTVDHRLREAVQPFLPHVQESSEAKAILEDGSLLFNQDLGVHNSK